MKEIGNLLREAREQKGISLEEVSEKTKIQERYLGSLEEGDFSPFAGKVYVRGALKNYAEAIGMDPQEVLHLYHEVEKQAQVVGDGKKQPVAAAEEAKPRFISKEKKPFPMVAFVWLLLLGIIAAGSIWYLYQDDADPDRALPYNNEFVGEDEPDPPEDPDRNAIGDPNEDENERPAVEPPAEELILVSRNGGEHAYALQHADEKEIRFEFTARCWVQVIQDGRNVQEKNFNPGETFRLGDGEETRIRLGYPAGARIFVNGMEVESTRDLASPVYVVVTKD